MQISFITAVTKTVSNSGTEGWDTGIINSLKTSFPSN